MEKLDKKVILALGTIATSGALFYFYTKSRKLTTLDLRNPEKTVALPLIKVIKISEDTRIFRFGLDEGATFGLPVGRHVNVKARINDKLVMRSYTPISTELDKGHMDLLIKVYMPSAYFPLGGKMSQYIENLKIGETLDFTGPKGRLEYKGSGGFKIDGIKKSDPTRKSHVTEIGMIAGGSGITPMWQIIQDVFQNCQNDKTKINLLFANKTEGDILLRPEIEKLSKQYPDQFKVTFLISRPQRDCAFETGRVTKDLIQKYLPEPGPKTMILICGPGPMVKQACLPNLESAGYQSDLIHVF